jgi:ADP-heptose:LPS heptosyltransferase/GT2 family glycosyltransferase
MKKYTISIVTYRPHRLVKTSIESVLTRSNGGKIKLVLTANGSREAGDYFETLRRECPDVVSVNHYDENQGFIIPNNRAFAESRTPYFVMLNDDVEIFQDNWLEALEAPLVFYSKAALSGPRGGCQHLTADFDGRQTGAFEYLEGSLLMVKADMVRPEPLFSAYLKHSYGEDSDLSLRMRRKGYGLHQIDLNYSHARAQTANHVHNIRQIQVRNHRVLCQKWSHYLRVRKFDFPIVVRRWASRGDVLLTTPIIRALSQQNPLSPIKVETAFPEFFTGNPYVAEAATSIQPTCDTRFINLDMAYENTTHTHCIDAYAQAAAVTEYDMITDLHLSDEAMYEAEAQLGTGKWVAMHLGPTTWPGKNWPIDRFNEVARVLKKEHGLQTLLVGHHDPQSVECDLDLRGATSSMLTAAVIQRCRLFVGLDSFPMHVAQAVGTPTVGLFGQTSPEYLMTDESPHIGVRGDAAIHETGIRHRIAGQVFFPSDGESMRSIHVEQVIEAVELMLRNHDGRRQLSRADSMTRTTNIAR